MTGLSAASTTCSGENNSDCGSEISGQPANTLGVHHGHSPCAIDVARNCTGGKKCDFASQGMVTVPDSHGQGGSRKESANTPMGASNKTRLAPPAGPPPPPRPQH